MPLWPSLALFLPAAGHRHMTFSFPIVTNAPPSSTHASLYALECQWSRRTTRAVRQSYIEVDPSDDPTARRPEGGRGWRVVILLEVFTTTGEEEEEEEDGQGDRCRFLPFEYAMPWPPLESW